MSGGSQLPRTFTPNVSVCVFVFVGVEGIPVGGGDSVVYLYMPPLLLSSRASLVNINSIGQWCVLFSLLEVYFYFFSALFPLLPEVMLTNRFLAGVRYAVWLVRIHANPCLFSI